MSENTKIEPRRQQVFISYALADREVAQQVAGALHAAGLALAIDEWELATGDSVKQRVKQLVGSSDILLVLLSPDAVVSHWVAFEIGAALAQELRDRAIRVIPALIQDCDIPPLLADRVFIDLRGDLSSSLKVLVEQIGSLANLNFESISPVNFELLVADLLRKLGFAVQLANSSRDDGFDLIATNRSRDPFGQEHSTKWLVQTKLYRQNRVSIDAIRSMMGTLMLSDSDCMGLIVTNGRLTSVARQFLVESAKVFNPVPRIIDGTELTSLLIPHPDLVRKYFSHGGGNE